MVVTEMDSFTGNEENWWNGGDSHRGLSTTWTRIHLNPYLVLL